MTPKAYLYLRFSSSEQAKGDSYRRQYESAKDYCQKNNLSLQDTKFEDLGISAYKGDNVKKGAFKKLLVAIEKGEIQKGDTIIVESLDRVSRQSPFKALPKFIDLLASGVNVVTLIDGTTHCQDELEKNPYNFIVSLATMIRAHEESRIKGERVSQAWENKYNQAATHNKPLSKLCPAWLDLVDGVYKIDQRKVKIIENIFELYLKGVGKNSIARTLNEERIPTLVTSHGRKAKQWYSSTIEKLISNKALIGEHTPSTGRDPIEGLYPPALNEATFHHAQQAKKSRARITGGRKGISFPNLLQGCCFCISCGKTMRFINKNNSSNWQYLVCSGAVDKTTNCNRLSYQYHDLELVVLLTISRLKIEIFEKSINPINEKLDRQLSSFKENLDDIQKQYDRAVNLHISMGEGDGNVIERTLNKLSDRREKLEDDIKSIELEMSENISQGAAFPALLNLHHSNDHINRSNFNQHLRNLMQFEFDNKIQEVKCVMKDNVVEILVPDEVKGQWNPTNTSNWY